MLCRAQRAKRKPPGKKQHAKHTTGQPRGPHLPPDAYRKLAVRLTALQRLLQIEQGHAFISLAGGQVSGDSQGPQQRSAESAQAGKPLQQPPVREQDITALVAGVTQWRRQLDAVIDAYAQRSMAVQLRQVWPQSGVCPPAHCAVVGAPVLVRWACTSVLPAC